ARRQACMGLSLSSVPIFHPFAFLLGFILLFDPRREHSSAPSAYFHRRRAQRRSRTALLQRRRRLVLDGREHGGRLVWGFLCQAFRSFILLLSFLVSFFCLTRAASILPPRPHISIAVARSGGQGRRFFSAAEGSSLTDASTAAGLYGAFFVKRSDLSSFCFPSWFLFFVCPAPGAFFRPDRIFPSPSRAAAVKDGASSAPPKARP